MDSLKELSPYFFSLRKEEVGLCFGRKTNVSDVIIKKCLVTVDPTMDCIEKAVDWKANLIISHHELFFDSLEALQEAMTSKAGQQAGQVLQKMTLGKLMLMVSDHNEDDMENIRRYAKQQADSAEVESES